MDRRVAIAQGVYKTKSLSAILKFSFLFISFPIPDRDRSILLNADESMTESDKKPLSPKEQAAAEKKARLEKALRENLKRRKGLQRGRGEAAPDAIKNKNRLTD